MTAPKKKSERHVHSATTRRANRLAADIRRAEAAGFHARGEQDWVPVDTLFSDPRYQRKVEPRRVEKMAAEFDPDALGVIYVSDRGNGTYAVMDGFHRVALMRHIGWGDQKMPAHVYTGLSVQEEAEIFTKMNKDRRQPHPLDIFRSEVAAGRPEAVGMADVFMEVGVTPSPNPGSSNIRAIAAAKKVFHIGGADVLRRTLKIMRSAWERYDDALSGDLLSGIALLIYSEPDLEDKHLINVLADYSPGMVLNKAAATKDVIEGLHPAGRVAYILVSIYNKRRRSKRLAPFQYQGWPRLTASGVPYSNGWSVDVDPEDEEHDAA